MSGSGEGDDFELPAVDGKGAVGFEGAMEAVSAFDAVSDDASVTLDIERYDPVSHPDGGNGGAPPSSPP